MEKGFVRAVWKFPVEGQRALLLESGLREANIYQDNGKNQENLDAVLTAFRGHGGRLKIAADLRVFGNTQKEVAEAMDKLEKAKIVIVDVAHPDLKTVSAQVRWAFARLAEWQRWGGDKKRAKRTGASGGHAKAVHQARKRAEKMPADAVRRLIDKIGKKLTWRGVEEITTFSTASLRRHYL